MNKLWISIAGVLLWAMPQLQAQQEGVDWSFRAVADTQQIAIGQQLRYQWQAQGPPDSSLALPHLPDAGEGWELLSRSAVDTQKGKGQWALRQEFRLTSFDSGRVALPPLVFFTGKDSLRSDSLILEVNIPEVKADQDYYDLKDILQVKRPWWFWPAWIAAGLLVLALIIWLILYLRNKGSARGSAPAPSIPPHLEAQKSLEQLAREELWQKGEIKAYYSQLVDILRRYLERRYGIKAMESTAGEVADKIRPLNITEELSQELRQMLEQSSLVKYARWNPRDTENERAWQLVRDFVGETAAPTTETSQDPEHGH